MCDTVVAFTKNGMIFGKNSDRDPDEVQNLAAIPAQDHQDGEMLKCTYIEIPQVARTHEIFLSKPYWIWGAEMGVNEHGVAIGNETIFTKVKPRKENKYLMGMDILRLGLERGSTAKEALDVMIAMLQEFGQGGNHGHSHKTYYNNTFLIADPAEAYVLETIDRMWAWKRVTTFWTISNVISITTDYDAVSPDLIPHAISKGWCKDEKAFNMKLAYTAGFMTKMAASELRRSCTFGALQTPDLQVMDVMDALRSHGDLDGKSGYNPLQNKRLAVCAHATGFTSPSQTTGSLVVWCGPSNQVHAFATGSSTPCTSTFKYVYAKDVHLPTSYLPGEKRPNKNEYWWQAEKFNHAALSHYHAFQDEFIPERKNLEQDMTSRVINQEGSQDLGDETFTRCSSLMDSFMNKHASDPVDAAAAKGLKFLQKLDRKTGLREI
ncbi:MAG TPA: carcinine hydrolase/isopenicillin-N N-acyltransferase family protein [Candidatus Lokiarchaeia archaeon]|nr:carcinine hydrolase/isopenicillin-N N-acyltransferase family protein [Candidatus Lokiarchaeia archaeon]